MMTTDQATAIDAYLAAGARAAALVQATLIELSELHAALPLEGRFAWRPPHELLRHLLDSPAGGTAPLHSVYARILFKLQQVGAGGVNGGPVAIG